MSINFIGATWDSGLYDGPRLLMMLALADHADADGWCFPNYDTLALKIRRNVKTVYRILSSLEDDGAIQRANGRIGICQPDIVAEVERRNKARHARIEQPTPPAPVLNPETGILKNETAVLSNEKPILNSENEILNPETGILKNEKPFYIEPSINRQGEPTPAREATPQAQPVPKKSPPPPRVQTRIPDRTPAGFQASSGYRPPPEPEPVQRDAATVQVVGHIANAVTEVTGVSAKLNRDEVYNFACDLHEAGYTAEQVLEHYGQSKVAERWHWYESDWRGKKGDRPRLKEIRETIAGAVAWRPADQLKQENGGQSWVERSIELARRNGLLPQPQTG